MMEGSGAESVLVTNGPGCESGRAQKNMDPTDQDPDADPDPQHWFVAKDVDFRKDVICITIRG